jgi:hypothetical protein
MELKELKKGEYFTIKPIDVPKENQVYIKGDYDKLSKTYSCIKFSDMNEERFYKGDKIVFTGFTF